MRARRAWSVLVLAAGTLAVAACANSRTPSALAGAGSESKRVAGVWWLAFGFGGGVYLVVAGLVVFGALRRGRDDDLDEGRRAREHLTIVLGGVVVPFLILMFFAYVTVNATAHLRRSAPSNAVQLLVHGERWWWKVQYPALGITTADEIHLPVGQPVHITLQSDNVIHSFWVPQLAGKEDVIPGQTNELSFTIEKPGRYRGECAEYCGVEHARMSFYVIAQSASDFTTWVAQEQQLSTMPTSDETAAGERVFLREACAGCHTIKGTGANGTLGPDLTDVGGRTTLAAATLLNTPQNMARWIRDPQGVKPGNLMPPVALSRDDVGALVAYLESLK